VEAENNDFTPAVSRFINVGPSTDVVAAGTGEIPFPVHGHVNVSPHDLADLQMKLATLSTGHSSVNGVSSTRDDCSHQFCVVFFPPYEIYNHRRHVAEWHH
jgi:hypothetical protein